MAPGKAFEVTVASNENGIDFSWCNCTKEAREVSDKPRNTRKTKYSSLKRPVVKQWTLGLQTIVQRED